MAIASTPAGRAWRVARGGMCVLPWIGGFACARLFGNSRSTLAAAKIAYVVRVSGLGEAGRRRVTAPPPCASLAAVMARPDHPKRHELFVIHAKADESFVRGYLIPALDLAEPQVLSSAALPVGMPTGTALEQAILESRVSVVVLSAAYASDPTALLGEQLAGYASGLDADLVPILLSECEVPLRL